MKNISTFFVLSTLYCCILPAKAEQSYHGISATNPTGSKAISAKGLMASYDFGTYTSDGLLLDFSTSANHGKLNKKLTSNGIFGQAREFSKKEDVVLLTDNSNLNLAGPLTIATKLKITTPNLHQHIFVCSGMFVLWLTKNNEYVFADTHGKGVTTTSVKAVANKLWHSVVATLSVGKNGIVNEDNMKVFIDGIELKGNYRSPWTPTELPPTNACVIGGDRNGDIPHQNLQFEGIIDELQVFSRAWTYDEVQAYSSKNLKL